MTGSRYSELGMRSDNGGREGAGTNAEIPPFVPASAGYQAFLHHFGGPVSFEHGARVRATKCPLADDEGYLGVGVFYGLSGHHDTLAAKRQQYADQLVPDLIPIGEADGGNLYCLDTSGRVVIWDHETDDTWLVANSFEELLAALEVEPEGIGDTAHLVKSVRLRF